MRELDRLLSLSTKTFDHWQDADVYAVTNIFDFYEEMGNSSLSEVVKTILENKEVITNEFLHGVNFNTSQELDFLDSLIDNYIQSGLMFNDPPFISLDSSEKELNDCIQAHQIMLYFISLCAIRLHSILQENNNFKNFVNVMMNKEIIYKTVAKKQADYGPSNISKFGIYGLIVRMHDKIGRLSNLIQSSKHNTVSDETVYDTLIDLVGYCTVSYLWINNWFLIPMKRNYVF